MFALVLAQHVEEVEPHEVVRMLLLHDIVEIDAGDAPIHMAGVDRTALERAERQAARRIFGLLPAKQGDRFLAIWLEFDAAETPNARFAKALDRLQPLLLNTLTDGGTWAENSVTERQVLERYGPAIERGSPGLWDEAKRLVMRHFAGRGSSE